MAQKHYYFFGNVIQSKMQGNILNEGNWDILRNEWNDPFFSMKKTVATYEKDCEKPSSYDDIAKIIIDEIYKDDKNKVISLGVGKGTFEWKLKKLNPKIVVECSDYTPKAIQELQQVNHLIDKAYFFDMLNGDYTKFDTNSYILMFRVSTEFDKDQWNRIFDKMIEANIQNVIFVPTELSTKKSMFNERIQHLKHIIQGKKDVFCGWLYSEKEIETIFSRENKTTYYNIDKKIPYKDTAVYFLKLNK